MTTATESHPLAIRQPANDSAAQADITRRLTHLADLTVDDGLPGTPVNLVNQALRNYTIDQHSLDAASRLVASGQHPTVTVTHGHVRITAA